jgi:hypothetical protein
MIRWLKSGAVAVCTTPRLPVVMILMAGFWAASAQIHSALIAASRGGEFVAVMLAILTLPFSCWLFANFLKLAHDLRELCVPKRRQLVAGALSLILVLTWGVPCGLLAWGHWAARELLVVALAMPAGLAVALLWRVFGHAAAVQAAAPADRRRALRIFLGPPYAPVSWRRRLIQVALVCAVLALPPVLVGVFGAGLSPRNFAVLLHAAELAGLFAATGLCWIWPLSRAVALFNSAPGTLSELALLPGLGDGRQRLRRLLLTAMGLPGAGLAMLLATGLAVSWRENLPDAILWKVVVEFLLILITTLPLMLGQIARPRAVGPWYLPLAMASQVWTFSLCLWMVPWEVLPLFMSLRWLAWLTIAVVSSGLAFVVGSAIHSVREISRRPQPFVEISP